MLPESNSLRTLNSWLVGSGYQIAKRGYYILQNEDGDFLCRRKTLAALKRELNARMAADAKSSELDCLPGELRRLLKTHGLRPVVNALAKAIRETVAMREHVPTDTYDPCSVYSADMLTAADNLESDLY